MYYLLQIFLPLVSFLYFLKRPTGQIRLAREYGIVGKPVVSTYTSLYISTWSGALAAGSNM